MSPLFKWTLTNTNVVSNASDCDHPGINQLNTYTPAFAIHSVLDIYTVTDRRYVVTVYTCEQINHRLSYRRSLLFSSRISWRQITLISPEMCVHDCAGATPGTLSVWRFSLSTSRHDTRRVSRPGSLCASFGENYYVKKLPAWWVR